MTPSRNLFAAGAALIVVIAGLASGYSMLGPGRDQRAISADERRVADLTQISNRLSGSAFNNSELPASLAQFDNDGSEMFRDPLTRAPYEYIRESGTKYQLCAHFLFPSREEDGQSGQALSFWNHPSGRYCYRFDTKSLLIH